MTNAFELFMFAGVAQKQSPEGVLRKNVPANICWSSRRLQDVSEANKMFTGDICN